MNERERLYFIASDISISEKQSNDIFLLISMRICSTRPNGNMEGVTEAFIEEVATNHLKYKGQPLYADTTKLPTKEFDSLGHMLDWETGTFHTVQIGSINDFQKVEDEYGVSLIGEARIPKREGTICQSLMEMYAMGSLNFSFEIRYRLENTIEKDGIRYVDASEHNALTGVAVVSVPAYKEAKALSLVAEELDKQEEEKEPMDGGDEKVNLDEMTARIAELEKKLATAEEKAEELEKEKTAKEEELAEKEKANAQMSEELANANEKASQSDKAIAELQEKVAELEPAKVALETMKAEAEAVALKEKQEKAKAFAQKEGLDTESEDVAKAIAELDYAAIAELSMANVKPSDDVKLASFFGGGLEVKDQYNGLLERG